MKEYCSYAMFKCALNYDDEYSNVIGEFKKEFGFYYSFDSKGLEKKEDVNIYIVSEAYEEEISSEEECIHSSHSRNKKYLLDGSAYTQNDASLYAQKRVERSKYYYYIASTNTKIFMDKNMKEVYISGNDIYNTLSYVVETLISIYFEYYGAVQLHGACCTWNGKGYIITGKSGKGKTTLMFNMLKKGALFHSNDRVAIVKEGEDYYAYSIPIPVNMPINMMRTLDKWKENKIVKNAEDDTKIRFLVKEFDLLFEGKMIAKTKVDNILVVNYSKEQPDYEYISDSDISKYVEVLTPYDENHPKWLPIVPSVTNDVTELFLEKMMEKVKFVKLKGTDIWSAWEKKNEDSI